MSDQDHGGNIRKLAQEAGLPESETLDFSANINPLGPPDWLYPLINSNIHELSKYPDPECAALIKAVAKSRKIAEENVIAGNGATEIIHAIARSGKYAKAVIPCPTYMDYSRSASLAGVETEYVYMREEDGFELDFGKLEASVGDGGLVFLCNPNNPTGAKLDVEKTRRLAENKKLSFFVMDESFLDFTDAPDSLIPDRPSNVFVLISYTKLFSIPGLRLGVAIADAPVASAVRKNIPPWSVNTLAQAVGVAAAEDAKYVRRTRSAIGAWRQSLYGALASVPGLKVYPGAANFLLVRIDREDMNAHMLAREVLKKGVAIRVCENFEGLDGRFFRVAVRTGEENNRLVHAIREALGERGGEKSAAVVTKRKPAIMFQGTGSSAGKSLLTAAMGRIMRQDGFDVAPFKAQNMSLNSYVTLDGKEMGRAQVLQAQACGLEPDVRMNPVLLKPSDDKRAQVIVNGEPVGLMDFKKYSGDIDERFAVVRGAYDSLAGEHDVMVLEGAGSPGEVNLKDRDIVNMRMARHADARVLIVGDIDRGGVFASFLGVMQTLWEWERRLVAGFVVNKFRGDETLLDDALNYTRSHAGRPVFGVVPYMKDLRLPDEDQPILWNADRERNGNGSVDIVIIGFKHVSNFTDFDPLTLEPDVRVRVAWRPEEINGADAVILPGSKNVVSDFAGMKQTGIADKLIELAQSGGVEIVGICGGFQALGRSISDPDGIESDTGETSVLDLLKMSTAMLEGKTLKRANATHLPSALPVYGYEIHHGRTTLSGAPPLVVRGDGEVIGARSDDGMVWGSYLHGMFDSDTFRRWFIDRLRIRKGLAAIGRPLARYDLEPALDRLADTVRESLRVNDLYKLMGLR